MARSSAGKISLGLVPLLLFSSCSSVSYLLQAGCGQLAIYNHERPLAEASQDARLPARVREQLGWVPEIKGFVEKTLGARPTANYTTYADIKRPYATWVLSSAPPYELKLKQWSFPFVGSFPYLGFFSEQMAREWAEEEGRKGQDASVRGAAAYSTLGYLRDPLLSSMLRGRKRDLVNLVFHETLHSHVYLKGQGAFNEQLAAYFGDYGERHYLETAHGKGSAEMRDWRDEHEDRQRMGALLRRFAEKLRGLYGEIAGLPVEARKARKDAMFQEFREEIAEEPWTNARMAAWLGKNITNNASLLAFLAYEDEQSLYEALDRASGGDLKTAFGLARAFAVKYEKEPSPRSPQQELRAFLKGPIQ